MAEGCLASSISFRTRRRSLPSPLSLQSHCFPVNIPHHRGNSSTSTPNKAVPNLPAKAAFYKCVFGSFCIRLLRTAMLWVWVTDTRRMQDALTETQLKRNIVQNLTWFTPFFTFENGSWTITQNINFVFLGASVEFFNTHSRKNTFGLSYLEIVCSN